MEGEKQKPNICDYDYLPKSHLDLQSDSLKLLVHKMDADLKRTGGRKES